MEKIPSTTRSPEIPDRMREFLNSLDTPRLQAHFAEHLTKCGIDPSIVHSRWVSADSVGQINNVLGVSGHYEESEHAIALNHKLGVTVEKLQAFVEKVDDLLPTTGAASAAEESPLPKNYETFMLSVYLHEETHALSSSKHIEVDGVPGLFSVIGRYSGYAQNEFVKSQIFSSDESLREKLFVLINEGVTDRFAEQVYESYRADEEDDDKYGEYQKVYKEGRDLLQQFIEKVGSECELEPEVVWRVVANGYFSGGVLGGRATDRIFQEVFPTWFWEQLGKTDSGSGKSFRLPFLRRAISHSQWTEADRTRVRRWIKNRVSPGDEIVFGQQHGDE